MATEVFLDVLSDWFHGLKLFLTQEKVTKPHSLGFAMLPIVFRCSRCWLAWGRPDGFNWILYKNLLQTPERCLAELRDWSYTGTLHTCAWAGTLQNSEGLAGDNSKAETT